MLHAYYTVQGVMTEKILYIFRKDKAFKNILHPQLHTSEYAEPTYMKMQRQPAISETGVAKLQEPLLLYHRLTPHTSVIRCSSLGFSQICREQTQLSRSLTFLTQPQRAVLAFTLVLTHVHTLALICFSTLCAPSEHTDSYLFTYVF